MGYQPIEHTDDAYYGNIVRYHKTGNESINERLRACMCPDCKAIFTIELPRGEKWRDFEMYRTSCPVCGEVDDWKDHTISIPYYKLIRWWRGVKANKKSQKKQCL